MRPKLVVLLALVVLSTLCFGQWSEPVSISDTALNYPEGFQLVAGGGDTLWAVYQGYGGAPGVSCMFAHRSMGDSWSAPETLASGTYMWAPAAGVDPQGRVWLSWSRAIPYTLVDSFGIFTSMHDSLGWGAPRLAILDNWMCSTNHAVDKHGNWYMGICEEVVISLTDYSSALYARFQGDTWAVGSIAHGSQNPYPDPDYVDYGEPTLVPRPDSGFWAVYSRSAYNENDIVLVDHLVPFSSRVQCGAFDPEAWWTATGDSAGQMWIIYVDTLGAVRSITYGVEGEERRQLVTDNHRWVAPQVCTDAEGWVWAFWARSDTSLVVSCNWGNNWSVPEVVTSKTGYPEGIVSDRHGRIYVSFSDTQGKYWTCYRTSRPGVGGDAAVKRPVVGRGATVLRALPNNTVAFDAMGRRVVNPRSGVFFIRDEGRGARDAGRTRKVVIQR